MAEETFNKGNLIPIKKLVFDIRKGSFLRTYYINYSKYKKFIEKIKSEKNKIRLNISNNELFNYYKKFSNKFFLISNIKTYFSEDREKLLSKSQINDIKQILPDNADKNLFNFLQKSLDIKEKEVLSKGNIMNKLFSNLVSYIITSDEFYLNNNKKIFKDGLLDTIYNILDECSNFLDTISSIQITSKPIKVKDKNKSNYNISNISKEEDKDNDTSNIFNSDINSILFDTLMDINSSFIRGERSNKSYQNNNTINIFETKIKFKPQNENKLNIEDKEKSKFINNIINRNFCYFGISHGKIINYLNPHEVKLREIFKNLIGNNIDFYDKIFISNIPFNLNIILKFKEKLPMILDNMFFFIDENLDSVVNEILLKENIPYKYKLYSYLTLFNNLIVVYKIDKNYFNNILSFIKDNIFITGSKKDLIYFIYNLFERKINKVDMKEYIYSSIYNSHFSDINISHTYYQNNIDYFKYLISIENNEEVFHNYVISKLFLSNLNNNDITTLLIDLFSKLNTQNDELNVVINTNEMINILSNTTNRFVNNDFYQLIKNILNVVFNYFISFLNKELLFKLLLDFQLERKILPIHFLLFEILYTYFVGKRSGFLFYDKIYKSLSSFHFPFFLNLINNDFYSNFNKILETKFNKNNIKKFQGKVYIPIKKFYIKNDILFMNNSLSKIYDKNLTKRIYPLFIGYVDISNINDEIMDFIEIEVNNDGIYLIDIMEDGKGLFIMM